MLCVDKKQTVNAPIPSVDSAVVEFIDARFGVAISVTRRISPSGLVHSQSALVETEYAFLHFGEEGIYHNYLTISR